MSLREHWHGDVLLCLPESRGRNIVLAVVAPGGELGADLDDLAEREFLLKDLAIEFSSRFAQVWNGQGTLGKNSDSSIRRQPLQLMINGPGNVGARRQVSRANRVGIEIGMKKNTGSLADQALDLSLPLFGALESRLHQKGEDFFRAARLAQEAIERTASRHAFAAFTGDDDEPARFHNARGCTHSFDPLVQVHVERVAAVARNHDIE
jgi:hypothetical protein